MWPALTHLSFIGCIRISSSRIADVANFSFIPRLFEPDSDNADLSTTQMNGVKNVPRRCVSRREGVGVFSLRLTITCRQTTIDFETTVASPKQTDTTVVLAERLSPL